MIVIIFLSESVTVCKRWFLEDLFRTMCKFTITREKNTLMDENISLSMWQTFASFVINEFTHV